MLPYTRNRGCLLIAFKRKGSTPITGKSRPQITIKMSREQRKAFTRLWHKWPPHLRDIKFGLLHEEWGAPEIDALAEVLYTCLARTPFLA